MIRLGLAITLSAALASSAAAQDFAVDDSASDGADSIGRAADGAFDAAEAGVGPTADTRRKRAVDGAGFDEDTAAVDRTYGEPAPDDALGSPEGTVQETGEFVDGLLR